MPNPVTGRIKVRYRLEKPGAVRLSVFTSDGRLSQQIVVPAR
jgi:ribosomal protein L18